MKFDRYLSEKRHYEIYSEKYSGKLASLKNKYAYEKGFPNINRGEHVKCYYGKDDNGNDMYMYGYFIEYIIDGTGEVIPKIDFFGLLTGRKIERIEKI